MNAITRQEQTALDALTDEDFRRARMASARATLDDIPAALKAIEPTHRQLLEAAKALATACADIQRGGEWIGMRDVVEAFDDAVLSLIQCRPSIGSDEESGA